jgi:hypothetical protein
VGAELIGVKIDAISTRPHHLSMGSTHSENMFKKPKKSTHKSHLSIPSPYPLSRQLSEQRIVDAALLTATPLFRQTTNATHQQSP